MKLYLINAAVLFSVVLPVGCKPRGYYEAAYVRDRSHHCIQERSFPAKKEWNFSSHAIRDAPGWRYFACDAGISIVIDDDEVQP